MDVEGTLDVTGLCVAVEAFNHRSDLAPAFGDAFVEQGHELANRATLEPVILPLQGVHAVSDDHVGGRKEQCTLVAGELEVQPRGRET